MKRTLLLRSLVVAGLALGLAGCKKSSASHAPGADYGGYDASYEEAAYDDESYAMGAGQAMPEAEPPPAPMPMDMEAADEDAPSFRDRIRTRKASREMASPTTTAAASEPQSPPAVEAPKEGADGGPTKAIEDDTDAVANRHIVYTAQMRVSVFNLETAIEKAEALPDTFGGYIQTMGQNRIVLRIPSKNLRKLMEDVGGYGVVEHRTLQAQDVTAEFTDIESRIRALTETQTQLLSLLSKARNVEEALHVRQALDNINTELEVLKGRMRQLGNQITFSTLTLDFIERGPNSPTPSSNDPFPWVDSLGVEATEWK